jgi:hypothetical protein
MMPGNLFRLQMSAAFGNQRLVILRICVSALLAMPFILVNMPGRAQVSGIVMVILFTSFFGTAVGHAHLRADLRFARLTLLPMSRGMLWLDLVLASTLSRLAPAVIVLSGFVLINGRNVMPASIISLFGFLCGSLVLLTLLGMGTGRLARSNGEVHLFGALACGAIALVSGVVPLPERVMWLTAATAWNPIARLLTVLTRLASGSASVSSAELAIASLVFGAVTVAAILRWISGGMKKPEKLDAEEAALDNGAR